MDPKRCVRVWSLAAALTVGATAGCRFDPPYRDVPQPLPATCTVGDVRCNLDHLESCVENAQSPSWQLGDDCGARGLVCARSLGACTTCNPGALDCNGQTAIICDPSGATWRQSQVCDASKGYACRTGGCIKLCDQASAQQSNIGCEYF